jgi:hypothetical protein
MIGCEDRMGITSPPIISSPQVSSTDPVNASTDVAMNQKIAATFSRAMDASTITTSTFTIMLGTTPVPGFVSYSGTTATFAPTSNLAPNTAYTAMITTGAKDPEGNALANNYVWSFTSGSAVVVTPPQVSSTDPANASTGVGLNQKIAAVFTKTMDATTITASTFTLMQGTTSVSGFVSYSGTTAIFAPSSNLAPNVVYTITITTGAKDLTGNALENNYVSSFTTGSAPIVTPPKISSTDPVNAATGVALNQKVAATFTKTMDASTITTATFTLMQGSTFISGTVNYVGTTATYTPTSNLFANTTYTATITTGAKDLTGNALVNNFVWSFTTGVGTVITPPTISLTDPVNSATKVALNQKVTATFSKTMDATTITTATFTLTQGTNSVSGFVSYSGTTATFAPAGNFLANTLYTATITTGVKDLAGNTLENNYFWSFTTGAAVIVTPPQVSSTDPANSATGVALNQKVAATFTKTMDASTITAATFTLMQGTTTVSGFVSYSGTTAILAPSSSLAPNTIYTATITTGAKDLTGNALVNNFVWSFTTGIGTVVTPPTVSLTNPANLATNVALNQKVTATFSETMDATTITTATFTLTQGTNSVSGFVSYSGTTATFAPAGNFLANTLYTATITTGAKDLAGNALLNNYVWSFTTGAAIIVTPPQVSSTNPANSATGVALNQKVAATFTKTMDASTITAATFTLTQGTTTVSGFVSYSGTTAILAPSSSLAPNTIYAATITTGAKDLLGNSLANNYVWTFTTGAQVVNTPPTVISTDPSNGAINVVLNKKITATFSTTMDPSTITTATFTLMQGFTFVSGTVSCVGTTATYSPSSNLSLNTPYTATITTGARDLAGNALVNNYVWSFASTVTYTITLSSNPLAGGTTSGGGLYNIGSSVTATATPNAGYTFTNWTENGVAVSTNINYQFTVSGDRTLVANFAPIPYTVTLSSNPAAGGTASGGGTFNSGSSVTVTAAPNAGYSFTNWTENGNPVSTNANYQFVLSGNRTLVANFATGQYTLTLSANPAAGGTASGGGSFNSGSSVTVTATPNTGYAFTNWTENGNPVSTNANYQFILSGNRTLVANFVLMQYTVILSSNPVTGGTTSGAGSFSSGSTVTVTATTNSGYKFTNWTENGTSVSTNPNYQFIIIGNRTLVANFYSGPIVVLGGAASFGGFGGSAGLTNQGIYTVVYGDLGTIAAASLVTGFHDGGGNVFTETTSNIGLVTGIINCAPPAPGTAAKFAIAQQALADATTAFNFLAGLPGGPDPGAGELGNLVLAPGTYTAAAGTFKITSGDLTLDAQNNQNAVFIFQMAQSLTVGLAGQARSINLVNGAQAKNVFWQVGSAATINGAGGGTMVGTIISYSGVTFSTAGNVVLTTLNGRALSLNASVTMVNTIINVPSAKK